MDNILNILLNYGDILINEASKPFFLIQKEQMRKTELILYHYQN